MKRTKIIAACAAAALALSGCGNAIEYKDVAGVVTTTAPTESVPDSSSAGEDTEKPNDDSNSIPDDSSTVDDSSSQPDIPVLENQRKTEDDPDYFKKCAFVGEAICSGLDFYVKEVEDGSVYAENSAHVTDIADTRWEVDGEEYALPDALYAQGRKYIYIWIGPNDLCNYDPAGFTDKYKELIEEIVFANPLAYVGVISVAPVSSDYEKTLTNGTIKEYNLALSEMIDTIGNNRVSFFNITATLADEEGHLLDEYASADGLHMTSEAYKVLAKYIYDNQIHPFLIDDKLENITNDSSQTDSQPDESSADDDGAENDTEEGAAEGEAAE